MEANARLEEGRIWRGFLPKSSSYGDGVLLSIGVIRCIQMADPFEVPFSPFFQSDFTIPIDRSATLFDWWWYGEL